MSRRLPAVLVFLVTCAVFAPTLGYQFQKAWDDGGMLLFNNHLTSWAWRFMLGSIYFGHWMPLTWLSWTVDAHLWGLWAGGWHGVNVLLHACNAVLVYLIAVRLLRGELFESRRRVIAVCGALLWAVHPMRMESVAWITERKDVLSGFFVLLALWSYLRYVAAGSRRRWAFYALSLSCFVLACLAKCIAVVLVPWLLLLDWSVLRRRALIEKAPYVLVAGLISEMAFYAVHVGVHNMLPWWTVGLGPRLLHVCYSLVFYAGNALWPSRLAHMIEYTWAPSWGQPQYPIAVGIVVIVLGVLLLASRRWLTAAVGAYVVAVLPQAGMFQNGPQLVGNRYSYLALLPLMLLVGAGLTMASRRLPRLSLLTTTAAVSAVIVVTSVNLPMWRDDTTLWTYAAEHEPTCTMCQDWAGVLAYARGDLPATRRYFERAIPVSLDTDFPRYERYWGLGKVLDEMHETEAAAATLRAYLNSVPAKFRGYAYEQHHIRDAEARLARLERSGP